MAHGRLQNFFRPWEAVPMRIKAALSLVLTAEEALETGEELEGPE